MSRKSLCHQLLFSVFFGLTTSQLWKDPSYMVVSPQPLCIDATVHMTKELFDAKDKPFLEQYLNDITFRVQKIFAWHNIKFNLQARHYWETGNPITIGKSVDSTMPEYRLYVHNHPDNADVHLLLSDIESTSKNLGRAFFNGVCTPDSHSIIQAGKRVNWNPDLAARVIAHEVGHILGFTHVEASNSTCNCPWSHFLCLMQRETYGWSEQLPTSFDSCSMNMLVQNPPKCLLDCNREIIPTTPPLCGNNILDPGEECDCGFKEACSLNNRSQCCNPTTCKLLDSSFQCAEGECCKKCRFSRGVTCRPKNDNCDIEDFCHGDSAFCGPNHIRNNGIICEEFPAVDDNFVYAYCNEGVCLTKDYYCKRMFPNSDVKYSEECFQVATRYANKDCAGVSSSNLREIFCGTGRGTCGQVYCSGNVSDPNYSFQYGTITCYTLLEKSDPQNLRFVPYGGYCGPEDICKDRKCVSITELVPKCNKRCGKYEECDGLTGECVPDDPRWYNDAILTMNID